MASTAVRPVAIVWKAAVCVTSSLVIVQGPCVSQAGLARHVTYVRHFQVL